MRKVKGVIKNFVLLAVSSFHIGMCIDLVDYINRT